MYGWTGGDGDGLGCGADLGGGLVRVGRGSYIMGAAGTGEI